MSSEVKKSGVPVPEGVVELWIEVGVGVSMEPLEAQLGPNLWRKAYYSPI